MKTPILLYALGLLLLTACLKNESITQEPGGPNGLDTTPAGLTCADSLPPIQMNGEWVQRADEYPHQNSLNSIVWTGQGLITVGVEGTVLASSDGETWTNQASGTTQNLRALACAPIGIVAVGDSGTIIASPDGTQWNVASSGTQHPLHAVKWVDTNFIAVGDSGVILASPDGSSWVTHETGTTASLRDLSMSPDQIVVVGYQGAVLTSSDGSAWIHASVGTFGLHTVGWTGTRFIASGGESDPPALHVLESSDGVTWNSVSDMPHFVRLSSLGEQTAGISMASPFTPTKSILHFSSDEGNTWSADTLPMNLVIGAKDVSWTGNRLVVIGDGGAILTLP